MNLQTLTISIMTLVAAVSCSGRKAGADASAHEPSQPSQATVDTFSPDSAYAYTERQVAFGPRVPGTASHRACSDWLVATLSQWADTVAVLGSPVKAWDGKTLPVRNIFAQFNPEASSRILLLAHYDTRPWADSDPDASVRQQPFDGANDGASGVGVLLEVARCLAASPSSVGVDILLTDVEDYGQTDGNDEASWCLGAQQFASQLPYRLSNTPYMGILLDMVGAPGAKFHREYMSTNYAPVPTDKVWSTAARLGLTDRFVQATGGAVNDDHIPLIKAGIPVTDIIEHAHPATGSFNPSWHTRADNMAGIDRATLGDVGKVVINLIYNEQP